MGILLPKDGSASGRGPGRQHNEEIGLLTCPYRGTNLRFIPILAALVASSILSKHDALGINKITRSKLAETLYYNCSRLTYNARYGNYRKHSRNNTVVYTNLVAPTCYLPPRPAYASGSI